MMRCDEAGLALIDDGELPPEVEAHLAGCSSCRSLRAAHQAALRLRTVSLELLPVRAAPVEVRALWRRRLLLRGTFVSLGAAVAAALLVATPAQPSSPPARSLATCAGEPPHPHAPAPAADPAPGSLEALLREVDSYTRDELSGHDDQAFASFGALPHLLAPDSTAVSTTGAGPHARGSR